MATVYVHTVFNEDNQRHILDKISENVRVVFGCLLPESQQQQAMAEADIVFGNPPAAWFDHNLPNLKLWQLETAGFEKYKSLDLPISVCNLQDYFSIPCAETMVAGILAMYRRIDELTYLKAKKEWVGEAIRASLGLLTNKKVVVLGAGSIGKSVKKMLSGFDCELTMMARTSPDADIHTEAELMAILPQQEIVINCLPGTANGFFTAEMIGQMPQNTIFANVGRGSTVDEDALIDALQSNKIAGAVLDVTALEPIPQDHVLWTLPNVILTQHSGGGQLTEESGKADVLIATYNRFTQNTELLNRIDLKRGY